MINIFKKLISKSNNGFILPLTLVIVTITLAVAMGISTILAKELYFSKISRESSIAYYAADSGLSCAIYVDDNYTDQTTGLGIFQYNDLVTPSNVMTSVNAARTSRSLPTITLNDVICGTAPIFSVATSSYAVASYSRIKSDGTPDSGKTTTFLMHMNIGGSEQRCAQVTVNKTPTFRQIISRGFNTCNTASPRFIERAVINTTEAD